MLWFMKYFVNENIYVFDIHEYLYLNVLISYGIFTQQYFLIHLVNNKAIIFS